MARLSGTAAAAVLAVACGAELPVVRCFSDVDCPSGICERQGDDRVCVAGDGEDSGDTSDSDIADIEETLDAQDAEDTGDSEDADDGDDGVEPDADADVDTIEPDADAALDAETDVASDTDADAAHDADACETPPCTENVCDDNEDNDDDGATDCDDPDCTGAPECSAAVCGDRTREEPEVCDGPDTGGFGCDTIGFTGGGLACNASCTLDVSGCIGPVRFELSNDSYVDGGSYQTAPTEMSRGDIIASCFQTPAPSLGYFLTDFAFMFGTGGSTPPFLTAYLWGARGVDGEPTDLLATYEFLPVIPRDDIPNSIGLIADFPELRDEFCVGVEVPTGDARLGLDLEGVSEPRNNWYFVSGDGEGENVWLRADALGFSGDWIIRAGLSLDP